MSNYVKATNFYAKDALLSGNPDKIIKGAEIDDEYNAIATSIGTKADLNSPTFTGTPAAPTASSGNNTTQVATTAFVTTAVNTLSSSLGNMSAQNKTAVDITGGTIVGITDLAVADGGTGRSALTADNVLLGNGTSAVNFVAPSTSGYVLTSNGTTWNSSLNPTIGVGQSWSNPSNSHGTSYQNTTSKPIMVSYGGVAGGKNVTTYLQVSTDNVNWVSVAYAFTSWDDDINGGCLSTIVPSGHYYRSAGTGWSSPLWAVLS